MHCFFSCEFYFSYKQNEELAEAERDIEADIESPKEESADEEFTKDTSESESEEEEEEKTNDELVQREKNKEFKSDVVQSDTEDSRRKEFVARFFGNNSANADNRSSNANDSQTVDEYDYDEYFNDDEEGGEKVDRRRTGYCYRLCAWFVRCCTCCRDRERRRYAL